MKSGSKCTFGYIAGGLIVGLAVGIIIGHFGINDSSSTIEDDNQSVKSPVNFVLDNVDNNSIREYLRVLAKDPHTGGTPEDERVLVEFIAQEMQKANLKVKIPEYEVLLSYPKREEGQRNYVAVRDSNGDVVKDEDGNELKSQEIEEILAESQDNPLVFNPFIAYAKAGNITGDLVYVNYARIDDFMFLEKEQISPKGNICIARYGLIFRGNKATYAERFGCIGLILFSDKADYSRPWTDPYPESWFLPKTGAQRGTTYLDNGDPETPFYPSIPGAYRWTRNLTREYGGKFGSEGLPGLPNIPITPIGYGDAYKLLSQMQGKSAPLDWQGGITHSDGQKMDYKFGPSLVNQNKAFMYVQTFEERRTTKNVIGYFEGSDDPDRYVIIGNHRDAWVFGSMDPSSGTCVMLEVIRVLGKMYDEGWRPKRTILFASWGSEEYGLIGSYEWVEEHLTKLTANSVVYINTDIAVEGNHTFDPRGSPNMRQLVHDVAKLVDNPRQEFDGESYKTVYDNLLLHGSKTDGKLDFESVGSGSDYTPFLQQVGASVLDITWRSHPDLSSGYPVYHSVYETFELVEEFVDPGFHIHQQVAKIIALLTHRLADDVILPMNVTDYAGRIKDEVQRLKSSNGEKMVQKGIDFKFIDEFVDRFVTAAETFSSELGKIENDDTQKHRLMNDKIMLLERSFIDPNGLPDRLQFRHVVFAPSSQNSYASSAFPAIYDALFDIDQAADQDKAWENVKEQFATLSFFIYNAANTLSLDVI